VNTSEGNPFIVLTEFQNVFGIHWEIFIFEIASKLLDVLTKSIESPLPMEKMGLLNHSCRINDFLMLLLTFILGINTTHDFPEGNPMGARLSVLIVPTTSPFFRPLRFGVSFRFLQSFISMFPIFL
jgi:hypothetical protein